MRSGGFARTDLVIYDCDGVLVDSEPIAIDVLCDMIRRLGAPVTPEIAYRRFLGHTWANVRAIIVDEFRVEVTDADAAAMNERLFDRFRTGLKPIPGVVEVIARIGPPHCVASSSIPERLRIALETTGLLSTFDPHVFSASLVKHGKPAPDLFLHVAAAMGVDPSACIVIEDSPSGVEAARRAGMRVVAFTGGGHVEPAGLRARLEAMRPDGILNDMGALPDLIGTL
jgi:HAD superfamily hydrolase (TIGR01509 family)